jgi:hypothetical protein
MVSMIGRFASISAFGAALVIAPMSFGAAAPRQQAEARLLDQAAFLCSNCFFGPSTYYYCFEAGDEILIGYQRTPVLNWQDKTKNYLTSVHSTWTAWKPPGQTVPVSYDAKHIWLRRPDAGAAGHGVTADLKAVGKWLSRDDSKEVKLTRSSKSDIFINQPRCRQGGGPKIP